MTFHRVAQCLILSINHHSSVECFKGGGGGPTRSKSANKVSVTSPEVAGAVSGYGKGNNNSNSNSKKARGSLNGDNTAQAKVVGLQTVAARSNSSRKAQQKQLNQTLSTSQANCDTTIGQNSNCN